MTNTKIKMNQTFTTLFPPQSNSNSKIMTTNTNNSLRQSKILKKYVLKIKQQKPPPSHHHHHQMKQQRKNSNGLYNSFKYQKQQRNHLKDSYQSSRQSSSITIKGESKNLKISCKRNFDKRAKSFDLYLFSKKNSAQQSTQKKNIYQSNTSIRKNINYSPPPPKRYKFIGGIRRRRNKKHNSLSNRQELQKAQENAQKSKKRITAAKQSSYYHQQGSIQKPTLYQKQPKKGSQCHQKLSKLVNTGSKPMYQTFYNYSTRSSKSIDFLPKYLKKDQSHQVISARKCSLESLQRGITQKMIKPTSNFLFQAQMHQQLQPQQTSNILNRKNSPIQQPKGGDRRLQHQILSHYRTNRSLSPQTVSIRRRGHQQQQQSYQRIRSISPPPSILQHHHHQSMMIVNQQQLLSQSQLHVYPGGRRHNGSLGIFSNHFQQQQRQQQQQRDGFIRRRGRPFY